MIPVSANAGPSSGSHGTKPNEITGSCMSPIRPKIISGNLLQSGLRSWYHPAGWPIFFWAKGLSGVDGGSMERAAAEVGMVVPVQQAGDDPPDITIEAKRANLSTRLAARSAHVGHSSRHCGRLW